MGESVRKALAVASIVSLKPDSDLKGEIKEALSLIETLSYRINVLKSDISLVDKSVDSILHALEQEDTDDQEDSLVVSKIRDLRRQRRKMKSEKEGLESILASMDGHQKNIEGAFRGAITKIQSYENFVGLNKTVVKLELA